MEESKLPSEEAPKDSSSESNLSDQITDLVKKLNAHKVVIIQL